MQQNASASTNAVPETSHKISLRQPKAVWAVAFACVIAFMGLGLVDPILTSIAAQLHATASQVELLFTSYMLVTGVMMLITGAVSSRIGPKWTLLIGLIVIVAFSALAGASHTVMQIVWFRAGWGVGNALFIATALAVIVGVASGGAAGAIILYEAALGLGISVGPLLGGWLGGISWRGPFYGVAVLMAIGFVAIISLLPKLPKPTKKSSVLDPICTLRYRGLLTIGFTAFFYNYGFFTLLGYTPFVLHMSVHGLGFVFFGWGIVMAIFSVFIAPWFQKKFRLTTSMFWMLFLFALDLLVMGLALAAHKPTVDFLGLHLSAHDIIIWAVVIAGAFLGVNGTLVTTAVMEVAPVERSIASAGYSFLRFIGGAIAPWLAGKLAEWYEPSISFYAGAISLAISIIVLFSGRKFLSGSGQSEHTVSVQTKSARTEQMRTMERDGQKAAFHQVPAGVDSLVHQHSTDSEFRKAIREMQKGPAALHQQKTNPISDGDYRKALRQFQLGTWIQNETQNDESLSDNAYRSALRNFQKQKNAQHDTDESLENADFREALRSMATAKEEFKR